MTDFTKGGRPPLIDRCDHCVKLYIEALLKYSLSRSALTFSQSAMSVANWSELSEHHSEKAIEHLWTRYQAPASMLIALSLIDEVACAARTYGSGRCIESDEMHGHVAMLIESSGDT